MDANINNTDSRDFLKKMPDSDSILYTSKISDLAVKDVITAQENISIREIAVLMDINSVGSVVLLDHNGTPTGIITNRDITVKAVSKGRDIDESASSIMSSPLISVKEDDFFLDAVVKMLNNNIHHILVFRENKLRGILTNHDLMLIQGNSPISFIKNLETQETAEGLIAIAHKINEIAMHLVSRESAKASTVSKIISQLNDKVSKRLLYIAEKKFGPAPVPYCWIVYGSEGRKEQTFKTDQDNALIISDEINSPGNEKAEKYFSELAEFVIENLIKCGFPKCRSDYMATNELWRKPLRIWKKYFTDWISTPTSDAKIKTLIFFDFRPIYGDYTISDELKNHAFSLIHGNRVFLGHIASMVIKNRPPVGIFGNIQTDKSSNGKNQLNLKINGIAPLVDMIRLFSLEKGIRETSTLERLAELTEKNSIIKESGEDIRQAFEFIMLLRINHQSQQLKLSGAPDNNINYDSLGLLEKKTLKDVFDLISKIQNMIIELYKALIW